MYAAARGYDDPSRRYPYREFRRGVHVRRFPLSSFGKSSIAVRLIAQSLFMAQAVVLGLFIHRLRVVVVSTSPPFANAGGMIVSWLRRVPLVWWVMDLNPDQMIAAGKVRPESLVARMFDFLNWLTLRRAAAVIVLDRFMAERINAKRRDAARKLVVIPPWPHVASGEVDKNRVAAFRTRHGLAGKFVVMYSGNHAIQHPLDTLLASAEKLVDDDRIRFVFIGGGAGKVSVDDRRARGAPNILSLPFQPLEFVGESLAAADVHVVSMGNEVVGIVHPCKVYGALAVGRPIIFFGPENSHVGDIMREATVGWRVDHGNVEAAVAAIKSAASMPASVADAMRNRATEVIVDGFLKNTLCGAICDTIQANTAHT